MLTSARERLLPRPRASRLAPDPAHESAPNAAMLMRVVDVEAVDLPFTAQLYEAGDSAVVLGDQDPMAPETPLPEGVLVDLRHPDFDLLRSVIPGIHSMHGLVVVARDLRDVCPPDTTDAHQQVRCRAATMRAYSLCRRLNSSTAKLVFTTRTSMPAARRESSVSWGTCMRP